MRAVWTVVLIVAAFLVGSYVDHVTDWPFGARVPAFAAVANVPPPLVAAAPPAPTAPPTGQSAYVPHYSNNQGLQDAPRAEVMEGRDIDMKRCVTTLVMRKVPQTEAQGTCEQMFGNE
jgi:hypothetical protein